MLGYKGYVIKEYFSNYFLHQSNVKINLENNSLEILNSNAEPWQVTLLETGPSTMTGGRIRKAREQVGEEPFFLTYGDGLADINIKDNYDVDITMTLTTPHCPEAQTIPEKVADVVSLVKGVNEVKVEITWEPPWTQDRMTEAAKLELGLM